MKQKLSEESKRERLETALIDFVERASKPGAEITDVAVLPAVAEVLAEMLGKETGKKEYAPEMAGRPCSGTEYVNFYGSDCKKSTFSL